jgi:hypothetical protein
MRVVTAAPFVPVCEISRLQLIDWIVSEIAWSRHLGWRMSSCRDSMVSKPIILGILVGTLFAAIPIHATNKTYETGKLNKVEIKDMTTTISIPTSTGAGSNFSFPFLWGSTINSRFGQTIFFMSVVAGQRTTEIRALIGC